MFVRIPFVSWARWGRSSLAVALCALPLYASCTESEDTEPYIRAQGGPPQKGGGDPIPEDEACDRLLTAAQEAYDRLGCEAPDFGECPSFLRPAGGSGCYEYPEGGIASCEEFYDDVATCRELSPCIVTGEANTDLPSCELVTDGEGGGGASASGGAGPSGGEAQGGAAPATGGAPSSIDGGAGGASPVSGGHGGSD